MGQLSADIEFTAECSKCGADLTTTEDHSVRRGWQVKVAPCNACVEQAREEGDDAGYERGRQDFEESDD
jgi:hypothetical protein